MTQWAGGFRLLQRLWAEYRDEAEHYEGTADDCTTGRERLADFLFYVGEAADNSARRAEFVNNAADGSAVPSAFGPPLTRYPLQ